MNVPLYAAALIVFSVMFLGFSIFLLIALPATLAAMSIVLALQLLRQGRTRPTEGTNSDPEWAEARARARRHSMNDQGITLAFIGFTWVIFYYLAPGTAQLLGPGWTYPSTGIGHVGAAELYGILTAIGLLAALTGALWYAYAQRVTDAEVASFRPAMIEPVPLDDRASCEFSAAYRYSVGNVDPPRSDLSSVHSGDLLYLTMLSAHGGLPRRFAICGKHRTVFVKLELWGRTLIARR